MESNTQRSRNFPNIHEIIQLISHQWILKQSEVIIDINKRVKENIPLITYLEKPDKTHEKYPNYSHI